jgi:WD40 repeat protein
VKIIVWSVSTGEVTHRLTGHTETGWFVCFSNDDYHLWSEDFVQKTRVFEMISEKCASVEKPLWAMKNGWDGGKSTDGRIEFSLVVVVIT